MVPTEDERKVAHLSFFIFICNIQAGKDSLSGKRSCYANLFLAVLWSAMAAV